MTFTPEQVKALSAKLDAGNVKQRTQAGRQLSYIEGWHAIAEANRIFGFDGWTREAIDIRCVAEKLRKIGREPNQKDGWGVSYVVKVRVIAGGIMREGVGAGHGIDVDAGQAHESAIKEAETDAMKRALMTFGNPFGLALYDKTQENVESVVPAKPQQQTPASAPTPAPTKPAVAPAAKPRLGDWVADRKREIDLLREPKAFSNWWQSHAEKLHQLEGTHPAIYEGIVQHFSNAQVKLAAA